MSRWVELRGLEPLTPHCLCRANPGDGWHLAVSLGLVGSKRGMVGSSGDQLGAKLGASRLTAWTIVIRVHCASSRLGHTPAAVTVEPEHISGPALPLEIDRSNARMIKINVLIPR